MPVFRKSPKAIIRDPETHRIPALRFALTGMTIGGVKQLAAFLINRRKFYSASLTVADAAPRASSTERSHD